MFANRVPAARQLLGNAECFGDEPGTVPDRPTTRQALTGWARTCATEVQWQVAPGS